MAALLGSTPGAEVGKDPLPELYFSEKLWSPRYGPNFYTCSVPSVRVGGRDGGGDDVAYYQVYVRWGEKSYTVSHRYSDFYALHSILLSTGAEEPSTARLFPPKTWFRSLDAEFLEGRRSSLSAWLDATLGRSKENASRDDVRRFLGLLR